MMPSRSTSQMRRCAAPPLRTESSLTLRWREPDSNHRSRSCERLFWALPIGDGGTKNGATYRFRSETATLASLHPQGALGIAAVPNVAAVIAWVRSAAEPVAVAELVDRRRAVGRADRQPAEGRLQWFQQLLAQLATSSDCQVRSVRDVWDAMEVGDLTVQEIAHEER